MLHLKQPCCSVARCMVLHGLHHIAGPAVTHTHAAQLLPAGCTNNTLTCCRKKAYMLSRLPSIPACLAMGRMFSKAEARSAGCSRLGTCTQLRSSV